MLPGDYKFKFLFIGLFFLFSFSLVFSASISLNDYPQIKSSWDDGELTIAINKLQEEAKKRSQNSDIVELLKKLTFQKKKFDQWLLKANDLLKQQKFKEATEILSFIKKINPNYVRYVELMNRIKTTEEELKYPTRVIFDGRSLDDNWKPYEAHKHHFSKYSRFQKNALIVNVPEKSGWAQVGIESNDTVIDLTDTNQSLSHHLKFKFDPKNTTGFAIDLEGKNIDKKSHSYNRLGIVYKSIDDKTAVLELHKDGDLHTKLEMDVVPESMELIIQPNNFMYLHLPDGQYLQTTSLGHSMPTKGYNLKIYSKPKQKELASKMSLKSIELKKIPFKKKKVKTVIFDGKYLEGVWKPYEAHKRHFSKYSRFKKNALIVNVPEKSGWAQVGIESNDTVIDLTDTNQSLSHHLKFKFDPKNTTGFAIDLEGENIDKKSSSNNKIGIVYSRINDKSAILELYKDRNLHTKLEMDVVPESMELIIKPNNFMYLYLPDGRYLQTISVKYPMPTKGYKLKVYSKPKSKQLSSKMSLKSIELRKLPFKKKKVKTVIFDGKYLEGVWKPYEAHKRHFSKFANFQNNTLIVNVPEKSGWAQVGIESNDTVIDLTDTNQSLSHHLKFKFDPKNTTGFAIDLEGRNLDKSNTYNKLQIFYKKIDNKSAVLELHKGYGALHTKLEMGSIAPESMELVVQPNNMMYLYLPDGRYLQTTSAEHPMPTKGYVLKVYSKPKGRELASKMALKSIELKREPFKKRLDPSNLGKEEGKIVLFDGKYFENRWIPYNEQYKKYFREYARFDKNGFTIDVPKNKKWARAGIISPEPIVWLDDLGKDGEYKAVFHFDPNNTTGFSIGVGSFNNSWKSPANPAASLSWNKVADQNISKLKIYMNFKLILEENLTAISPSVIVLGLKDSNVTFSGDTFKSKSFKWPYIVESRPLHLWAYSHAYKNNLPAKMALGKIVLDRKPGTPIPIPKPAPGVKPLLEKEIFGSGNFDKWECYKLSGDKKDTNCTLDLSNLDITIQKGKNSLYGMKSKNKIIMLDSRRIEVTPLNVSFYFDPAKTDSFDIAINTFYKYHITLQKSENDTYVFSWNDQLKRRVDAKWLKNVWNGKVDIIFAKKWIKIALGNGVEIPVPTYVNGKFSLAVFAFKPDKTANSDLHMQLKKITTEWIIPDGMTATDRWNLIDDADFDPDAFLNEIREVK